MRKILVVTLGLLVSAVWMQAQDAGKTSNLETIEGCLQRSEGQYSLIDETNTIHHLAGGGSKLKDQVGHQVEITGKAGVRNIDTTTAGLASSVVVQPVIEVKSVKYIADTCK